MKTRWLTSLAGALFALVASAVLTSCGGGGAQGNPQTAGALLISPAVGTIYAGVPFNFQIFGGRTPYALTSSEPGVLPLPSQIDGHSLDVVAANPGVIDAGLKPDELPVRTVNITVRSGDGQTSVAIMKVGVNFLTGYGISFSPLTCPITVPSGGASTVIQACAGGETAIDLAAVFNGNLHGGQDFRFQVLKGPFFFEFPQGGTGDTITVTSDHSGHVNTIIRVTAGVPTQLGVIRVIEPVTGVYEDFVFTITGVGANGVLTLIPSTITFTGVLSTDCGIGSANFFAFDGTPPYTALSANPAFTVNATSNSNPGVFTVTSTSNVLPCNSGPIVVTDAFGARATVDVKSVPGTGTPPKPATFTVAPTSITLGCAESGSVTAVGGSGSYFTTSSNAAVTAVVSGNTVTITRQGPAGVGAGTLSSTVAVTDGGTIQTVSVTSPATCP